MEQINSELSSCSLTIEAVTLSSSARPSCVVCLSKDKHLKYCSNCKLVAYCSTVHQSEHWKVHKKTCFPIREECHPELGRFLVATRRIKEGDLIFQERPILVSPYARFKDDFWAICFGCCCVINKEFLKCKQLCEQCSWPLCGTDCSKILDHSNFECKVFRKAELEPIHLIRALIGCGEIVFLNLLYPCVQVIRCLLLREIDPKAWEKILKIDSFEERRKFVPIAEKLSKFVIKFVREICKLEEFPNDLVDKIFGVTYFHASAKQRIYPDGVKPSLCITAIAENVTKLTHDCQPNSQRTTSADGTSRVLAIRDVEFGKIITQSLDPDSLFVEDVVGRRQYLHNNFGFWCTCSKCTDPTEQGALSSAIKCQKVIKATRKDCHGFYLPISPLNMNSLWKCNNAECGWLKSYAILCKETLLPLKLEISRSKTLEEKISTLEKNKNITVHENHCYLVMMRQQMVTSFALKMEENHELNSKEWNSQFLQLLEKCLELYTNFGLGKPIAKGALLFYKALVIERTLPPGSFLGKFQPTKEYLECVTAAVDFVRDFRLFGHDFMKPPIDSLGLKWLVLKRAKKSLLKLI